MKNLKQKVSLVLEHEWFQSLIVSVILVNVAGLMLESMVGMVGKYQGMLSSIEKWSMVVFSVEYVLRIWSCNIYPKYSHPVTGRLRFAVTPFMLIDFIAIAPFYMPFLGVDMRVLRLVRIFRILRLGKLIRYSRAIQTLVSVLRDKTPELGTVVFILLLLILFSSTMMYYAENAAQPNAFSSIPASMWWAVITLASVGYGDMTPVTVAGKLIAGVIALLGIGMFALPAGILGSAFTEAIDKEREKKQNRKKEVPHCPHCGKKLK